MIPPVTSDFFERQEKAHRKTHWLVIYFLLGVTLMIVAIYAVALMAFAGTVGRHHHEFMQAPVELWRPKLFAVVAVGTLTIIAVGSLTKTAELSRGGSAVADMLGGRPVNSNTTDPDERKLLNVVEEMALASGVPVPQVYVMDRESGINAFAAGHSTSDAVVAVTRGCMRLLSRDELQGVIGHEFSHILNGDMRLNIRLMGVIFGILCLTVVGRVLVQSRGGNSRDRNALPVIGLVLIVFGWFGVLFGRLIQAAVSRQREFLADASSVQFTRNPAGISGALKKIGGLSYGSKLEAAHADEASHMYFGNGVGESMIGLMDTHPPLDVRIRAIDPTFDGVFPRVEIPEMAEVAQAGGEPPALETEDDLSGAIRFPPLPGLAGQPAVAGLASAAISHGTVLPNMNAVSKAHLHYAVALRNSFPPAIREAARDALGACALVYGMLLSGDSQTRARQLDLLSTRTSDAVRRETERLLPDVDGVACHARLPLVELALPGLRHLSPAQYGEFSSAIKALIESDDQVELHEYVLQKIVLRHLDPQFNGARKVVVQYYALRPLSGECSVLLSAVAHAGSDDPGQAEAAFRQGADQLTYYARCDLQFVPSEQCDLEQVDAALNRISEVAPQIKKNVLNACALTVAADGVIQETEAQLLRAIADTLDCPMPPFIQAEETVAG